MPLGIACRGPNTWGAGGRKDSRRRRLWAVCGAITTAMRRTTALAIAACLAAAAGCAPPPKSFKAVKTPRPGRAIGGTVAIVYSKHYQIHLAGLEKLHSFDINKYARIYVQLQKAGYLRPADVFVPRPITDEQIRRVHTEGFLRSLRKPAKLAGYLEVGALRLAPAALTDAGILSAFRHASGGTLLAGRLAVQHGVAINLGGGYHHATPDAGGGFNVYNDLAIAVRTLQAEDRIRRALIVDLDVHQGNGTAVCFEGDDSVYTFSMHEEDIYPIPKARSDRDVALPPGAGDRYVLRLLARHLPEVLREARPDVVFLQAGCDMLAGDPLARLQMTPLGIVRRDAMVIDACVRRAIPVAMTLGGGYSRTAWAAQYLSIRRTLDAHGLSGGRPYPARRATLGEKLYTK